MKKKGLLLIAGCLLSIISYGQECYTGGSSIEVKTRVEGLFTSRLAPEGKQLYLIDEDKPLNHDGCSVTVGKGGVFKLPTNFIGKHISVDHWRTVELKDSHNVLYYDSGY